MQLSLRALTVVLVIACWWPGGTLGSWAQMDGATKSSELRSLAVRGSQAFVEGSAGVHQALIQLDSGNRPEAVRLGSAAAKRFVEAGSIFKDVSGKVSDDQDVVAYLKRLDVAARTRDLGITASRSPDLWAKTTDFAKSSSGGQRLFGEASRRASEMGGLVEQFFGAVSKNEDTGTAEARLLVRLGEEIAFGGYVTAIFAAK